MYGALFSYVKISIAGWCRDEEAKADASPVSKAALFWCGVATQLGSAVGALVMYFLVNHASIFQQYYPCA